ncbi:MAG: hypothetical protein HQL17_06825 [Candidatus Omnitrophica bacterium]|nr:hypothetical protein [Candidatus Omnitrophota bacterium]
MVKRILLILAMLMGSASMAQAVVRTWDGGGGNANWATPANWSADTLPGTSDVATFDNTCVSNCSPTIAAPVDVAGIDIKATYAGTITQNATVNVRTLNYVQAGGTFTGATQAITISGTYTLTGGTFTSTSGTMTISRGNTATTPITIGASATFNHNNGTLKIYGSSDSGGTVYTLDINNAVTLNNIILEASGGFGCCDSSNYITFTPGSGQTINAIGDFTINGGYLTGAWQTEGNFAITYTGTKFKADGGTGTVTMTGTASKTYSSTGGVAPVLRVNKTGGATVTPLGGTTTIDVTGFWLIAGSFTAPSGELKINAHFNNNETIFSLAAGTTFNHNSGTLHLYPEADSLQTLTLDIASGAQLNNINFDAVETGCCAHPQNVTFVPAGAQTIVTAGYMTITGGKLNGNWETQGHMTFGAIASGGTGAITLSGTNVQNITDNGGTKTTGMFTVNKSSGTATLATNVSFGGGLTITSGTIDANGKNVSATSLSSSNANTRTITMGTGIWTLSGTGAVWDVSTETNLTLNANTSTIAITDASAVAKTFAGGTRTYNNITVTPGGAGTLTYSGAFTFANMTMASAGTKSIVFTKNTIYTMTGSNFLAGTSGNLITIASDTGGTAFTLSKASGNVVSAYLSLKDSTANGGANWYAGATSTNVSGNSGWSFASIRTIANGGGNWSSAATWVEGVVPAATDIVLARSTSGNLTIDAAAACRAIDLTNYTGIITHNAFTLSVGDATGGAFNFSGAWTYTAIGDTSAISFVSTDNASNNITWGGKTYGNLNISSGNNGTTFVLQDTLTQLATTTTFTWTRGNLNVNGTTMNIGRFSDGSGGSYTRSLTLGAANINASVVSGTPWSLSSSNLTFNAGTSTITASGTGPVFAGAGQTYNNVVLSGAGTASLTGANTFTNLTRTGTAAKTDYLALSANQIITGTLTINGNSATNRVLVSSDVLGTVRTLTAANVAVTNADFRDITGAGAGSWNLAAITGLSGDAGGNSGITFTPAAAQTWTNANGGNWSTVANWTSRVPLPQDDVVMGIAYGVSKTVTADMPRLGKNIDWTGATNSPSFSYGTNLTVYGSLTLISAMSLGTSNSSTTFEGRGAFNLTMAGKQFGASVNFNMIGGTLLLQDDYYENSGIFTVNNGTFDANNHNVTVNWLNSSNSNTRAINMGSGTWTVIGSATATVWDTSTVTNLTLNAGTSTIVLSDAGANNKTFAGGGLTYKNVSITGAGAGAWTFSGSNTFNNFTINAPKTVKFTSGTTQTISGNFTAAGSSGNVITITSTTGASAATLSKAAGTVTGYYMSLQDMTANGGATWRAVGSTNVSGNTGWTFINGRTISAAGGNWSATTAWVEGVVPTSSDVVMAMATSGNLTIDAAAACREIDLSNYPATSTLTHNAFTLSVGDATGGSLNFSGAWTYNAIGDTSAVSFISTTTGNLVTTAGKLLGNVTFDGNGGGWTLQDDLTLRSTNATFGVTSGTFNSNGKNMMLGGFVLNFSANPKTVTLDNSVITCQRGSLNGSINVANSGTTVASTTGSTFVVTGAGAVIAVNPAKMTFNNLTITGSAVKTHTVQISSSYSPTITGTLTINGNSSINRILVYSSVSGTATALTAANVSVTNADFRDITGAGAGNWDLSAITGLSGDAGGNSGITFTPGTTLFWYSTTPGTKTWSTAGLWYRGSGGTGGAGHVPLPQDDAVFNAASIGAGATTVSADMPRLGKSINWTGVANSPTFAINTISQSMYGSLTLVSGMNVTSTTALSFSFDGRGGAYTWTSAGKSILNTMVINTFGGSMTLQDGVQGPYQMTFNGGTFNANNFNVSAQNFRTGDGALARTVNMGSGTWTISGSSGSPWNIISTVGLTYNKDTSTIILSDAGVSAKTFVGGGLVYNNVSITGVGAGSWTFTGSNTFNDFTINAPMTVKFTAGTAQTISGRFLAVGSLGNLITMDTDTGAGTFTLSKTNGIVASDYLSLTRSTANGGAKWYTGANSTNGGSNTGWMFKPRPSGILFGGL